MTHCLGARRRLPRLTAGLILALTLGTPAGARADTVYNGECSFNLYIVFDGVVSQSSSYVDVKTIAAGGECVVTGVGVPPQRTMEVRQMRVSELNSTSCSSFVAAGTYALVFTPNPAPEPSYGTFALRGTANALELKFSGSNPTFIGETVLESADRSCWTGGTRTFSYAGRMVFVDP